MEGNGGVIDGGGRREGGEHGNFSASSDSEDE